MNPSTPDVACEAGAVAAGAVFAAGAVAGAAAGAADPPSILERSRERLHCGYMRVMYGQHNGIASARAPKQDP